MYTIYHTYRTRPRRGSVVSVALVIVVILSFSVIALVHHVHSMHRLNQRTIAWERAAVTAEAGIYKIMRYFSHPEDLDSVDDPADNEGLLIQFMTVFLATVPPDGGLHAREQVFGSQLTPGQTLMTFVNVEKDAGGSIDESSSLNENLIVLGNSRVTNLKVTAPRAEAEAGTVFTFWSTAETQLQSGGTVQRTALMDINFNPALLLTSPCGIATGCTVASHGQFNLHWGEAWAGDGGMILKMNKKDRDPYPCWAATGDTNQGVDQWTRYMTANSFLYDSSEIAIINDRSYQDVGKYDVNKKYDGILYQYVDDITPPGEQTLTEKINETVDKFGQLNDPENGYEFWKSVAIKRDTYFRQGYDGNIYNADGNQLYIDDGVLNTEGHGESLTVNSAMEYYRGLDNVFLIFFDTKDGNPPASDGSNWANASFTGSISECSHGLLYVAGHLDIGGSGTPPSIKIRNPAEVEAGIARGEAAASANVFHDGIIFAYGNYKNRGNPIVYGSVVCKGSYDCGGTPNLYYNAALKDGEPFQVSNPVRIRKELILSGYR